MAGRNKPRDVPGAFQGTNPQIAGGVAGGGGPAQGSGNNSAATTYIEGSNGTMASGVAQTVTLPTGLSDGDWMFIYHFYSASNNNITVLNDTGWTRYKMTTTMLPRYTIFYKKFLTGQQATVDLSYDGAMAAQYHTFAYRGLNSGSPVTPATLQEAQWPGSGAVVAIPALTTQRNNSTILCLSACIDTSPVTAIDNGFTIIASGIPAASRSWAHAVKTGGAAGSIGTTNMTKATNTCGCVFELYS